MHKGDLTKKLKKIVKQSTKQQATPMPEELDGLDGRANRVHDVREDAEFMFDDSGKHDEEEEADDDEEEEEHEEEEEEEGVNPSEQPPPLIAASLCPC